MVCVPTNVLDRALSTLQSSAHRISVEHMPLKDLFTRKKTPSKPGQLLVRVSLGVRVHKCDRAQQPARGILFANTEHVSERADLAHAPRLHACTRKRGCA